MYDANSMVCRENELDADAEYDVDGGLDMYESRKKKGTKVGPLTFFKTHNGTSTHLLATPFPHSTKLCCWLCQSGHQIVIRQ